MMHRAATQFSIAETAQMLRADVSHLRELIDVPFRVQMGGDFFPELREAIITLPGPGERVDVIMNQLDPMMNGFWRAPTQAILEQSKDRVLQGLRTELRQARRSRSDAGLLIRRLVKPHPAKIPSPAFHHVKRVQHVRQKEKRSAGCDALPLAVGEHAPFTAEARQEKVPLRFVRTTL